MPSIPSIPDTEINAFANLQLDVELDSADLAKNNYYIIHFNHFFTDSWVQFSSEIQKGFSYNYQQSATPQYKAEGNVIICKWLQLLILIPGETPLKAGRVLIKGQAVWRNPDYYLFDVPLQNGLTERQIYATVAHMTNRTSVQVNYTSKLHAGSAILRADNFSLRIQLTDASLTQCNQRNDFLILVNSNSFHKINRMAIIFPDVLRDYLWSYDCMESAESEVQVGKCWIQQADADKRIIVWIHISHNWQRLQGLDAKNYQLAVRTLHRAIQVPPQAVSATQFNFTIRSFRWLTNYNQVSDYTTIDVNSAESLYEDIRLPNSDLTINPFQIV